MEVYNRSPEQHMSQDEEEDMLQSIRQLKHEHEALLREKKQMEAYCLEVRGGGCPCFTR